jgi:hypothetical protein
LRYLLLITLFTLLSCTNQQKSNERIDFYRYSSLVNKYDEYEITPFRREMRVVIFPDKKVVDFLDSGKDGLRIANREFNPEDSLRYQKAVMNIRKDFNTNDIIALFSEKSKTEIFLTISDSTISQLERKKDFYHNELKEEKDDEIRYVLVYIKDKSQKKNIIEKLGKKYKINCIDSLWYYYRSFRFNSYDKF